MQYLSLNRSGIWQFRYKLPISVRTHFNNRTEIKRSLNTSNKAEAELLALDLLKSIKEKILMSQEITGKVPLNQKMVGNVLTITIADIQQKIEVSLNPLSDVSVSESSKLLELAKDRGVSHLLTTDIKRNLISSTQSVYPYNTTPDKAAEEYINTMFLFIKNEDDPLYFLLLDNLTKVFTLAHQARQAIETLNYSVVNGIQHRLDTFKQTIDTKTAPPTIEPVRVATAPQKEESKAVDISKVLDDYTIEQENKGVSERTIIAVVHACKIIHELVDKSDMKMVDRADANRALGLIKDFPKDVNHAMHKGAFTGLNALKVITKNKKVKAPVISEVTAQRYVERASIVYRWAVRQNYITYNPWEGLASRKQKANKKQVDKRIPFNSTDLKNIFSHEVFTTAQVGTGARNRKPLNYQYWVPLICLLSGMRPNEVCQLLRSDIKQINGVWCFDLQVNNDTQSLKNANAARVVPVHNKLIELGFIKFIEGITPDSMVFSELNYTKSQGYYKSVSNWFKRTLSDNFGWQEQNKTFYSLRHTFVDWYKQKGLPPQAVGAIVGHETGTITYDTYGGSVGIEKLHHDINLADFSDVLTNVKAFM